MEYRLHHEGREQGVFQLEELRRRRAAGELSGQEWVWREGMPGWASLDSVLEANPPVWTGTTPPPIPAHALRTKRGRPLGWLIALAIIGSFAVGTFTVVRVAKVARRLNQSVQTASNESRQEGLEVTRHPIPVTTNSLTEEDVRKRGREFRVRQYLQAYRDNGPHDQPWDAQALQLLESWIAANYGGATNLPSPQSLADRLAATAGCDDPLVLLASAVNATEVHEKMRRLGRATAGFPQSRYKAYPQFYATVALDTEVGRQPRRAHTSDESALEQFTKALTDGSFLPADEQEVSEILINGWGKTFFERNGAAVCSAVARTGNFPWLALVLEGDYQIAEAWKARGNGYANSVTSEGWQNFSEHLAKAQRALTEAWKLHPDRPQAAARMISVATGESGAEEVRTWFDRAVSAQMDYPQAWTQLRWGLRPRWHGSHEALLAMGVRALDTARFDTEVPRKYFDFVSDVESELELAAGEHIYGRADIWPQLKRMYEGYMTQAGEGERGIAWRSAYVTVAYLAGQYDTARKQLEVLNWKPAARNLQGWGTDLSLLPVKVAALTGAAASQVARAEQCYAQVDLPEATRIYSLLAEATNSDERTRLFCRSRLDALKQESRLAKGEWIELLPADPSDPNWIIEDQQLRRLDDGAIEVKAGIAGHAFYCRTRVGPEFEVTGDVDLVSSSTRDFQAGLILGLPDSQNSDWYAFRLKRNDTEGELVSFSRHWGLQQVTSRIQINDQHNSFRFRLQGGKADAWINGNQVLTQASPSKTLRIGPECMVGLGAYNDMNQTVLRYRNVKLRRLGAGQ